MALDSTVFYGFPRIKILSAASPIASVVKTLYLPLPDKDGLQLIDSPFRGIEKKLLTKTAFIGGGIKKSLTINWSYYDPKSTGKVVGIADGQTPNLADLYDVLTANQTKIMVSPCSSSEIWFRAYIMADLIRNPVGKLLFKDVSIEFKGCDVFASANASTSL